MKEVRWAVLGTGVIANEMAVALSKNGKHISLSREEDGSFSVNIHFLSCKYPSLSGEKHVISLADNWLDYFVLQENIEESIITLTNNYEAYKSYYEAAWNRADDIPCGTPCS